MSTKSHIKYSDSDMGDNELVIDNVFVAKEDRGQGLGKKLVNEAINYAKLHNYETVGLYADPQSYDGLDSDALIEFYSSIGFVSSDDDAALMTLSL